MLNFENLDKFQFTGVGKYGIPQIEPVTEYLDSEFIPCNYAKSEKRPEGKIVHCFVDDYQFIRYWNQPDLYISMLSRFKAVCAPDFSIYTDMPLAMQIYNHYRKHWLAAYWQLHGLTVYPSISWSTPDSYDWCFDGEPVGGIVAVSSVGVCNGDDARKLFFSGYNEMVKRLKPARVIWYGKMFEPCDQNIIHIPEHGDQIKKRAKAAAERRNPWEQLSVFHSVDAV